MIQNQRNVASYLLLRDGIYYFQVRLKRNDLRRNRLKSGLIRKSLKTSNYREAVHKARILWFEYVMTDDKTEYYEGIAQRQADMYSRGKELHQIYNQLDENDLNQVDSFFAHEFGTAGYSLDFDKEAFAHYQEHYGNFNPTQTHTNVLKTMDQPMSEITLAGAIDRYLHECKNGMQPRASATITKYESELRFFISRIGNKPLSQVLLLMN